jgi:hypothetical protein
MKRPFVGQATLLVVLFGLITGSGFCFSVFASPSPSATSWVPISTNHDRSVVIYADLGAFRREASVVRVRLLFDHLGASEDPRRSYVTTREYQCDRGLARTLDEQFFAEQMGSGKVLPAEPSPDCEQKIGDNREGTQCAAPWSGVLPRTVGNDVFKAVCKMQAV